MTPLAPSQEASQADSLSTALKQTTALLHTQAEQSPRMKSLARGEMDRDAYGAHLCELHFLHEALETHLDALRATEPAIRSVVDPVQYQAQNAVRDLEFLGVDAETLVPSTSIRSFRDELADLAHTRPLTLLGMHYVLEGSKNGGRILARVLRKTYNLEPGFGDRYMDPYGESQPKLWASFKKALDSLCLSQSDLEDVLDGARRLFELMIEVGTPSTPHRA